MARGPRQIQTVALSVHDHIVAGRGGSSVVWPSLADRNRSAQPKQTVSLYRICAHSAEMMEKELMVAVMAYNLVRAIMFQAARRAQIDPRQLSFTYACNIVLDGYAQVLAARTASSNNRTRPDDRLGSPMQTSNRTKRRSYPREVWAVGIGFPLSEGRKTKWHCA